MNENQHRRCDHKHVNVFRPRAEWIVWDGDVSVAYCGQHTADMMIGVMLGIDPAPDLIEPMACVYAEEFTQ